MNHGNRRRALAASLLTVVVTAAAAAAAADAGAPAAPTSPDVPPSWLEPTEPFHVIGGIFYVGTAGLGAYLFTSDEGHVLLDGGLPENAPQIEASIARLGFRIEDVKILLNSHAHFDHSGGLAALKQRSGAELHAHSGDVSALEGGFYLGSEDVVEWRTPPVTVDHALEDGAVVELGRWKLVLHHTPGHSRGCSSWGTTLPAAGGALEVLVFCSASVAANRLENPPQYPGIIEDYRRTFARAGAMTVHVPLAPHPEFFDLLGKRDRRAAAAGGRPRGDSAGNPFVDPGSFHALIERFARSFERELEAASGR